MTVVIGSNPVIGNHFPHFSFCICYFNVQTALCIDVQEIYDKQLFDIRHWRQTITSVLFTPYSLKLIRICLLM